MECPICLLDFSEKLSIPRSLPCGHTVCQVCLQKISACPLCKTQIPSKTACPLNYSLLHAMEDKKKRDQPKQPPFRISAEAISQNSIIHNANTVGMDIEELLREVTTQSEQIEATSESIKKDAKSQMDKANQTLASFSKQLQDCLINVRKDLDQQVKSKLQALLQSKSNLAILQGRLLESKAILKQYRTSPQFLMESPEAFSFLQKIGVVIRKEKNDLSSSSPLQAASINVTWVKAVETTISFIKTSCDELCKREGSSVGKSPALIKSDEKAKDLPRKISPNRQSSINQGQSQVSDRQAGQFPSVSQLFSQPASQTAKPQQVEPPRSIFQPVPQPLTPFQMAISKKLSNLKPEPPSSIFQPVQPLSTPSQIAISTILSNPKPEPLFSFLQPPNNNSNFISSSRYEDEYDDHDEHDEHDDHDFNSYMDEDGMDNESYRGDEYDM